MKINMLCKTLLLAGLTAAMLTGCGKSGIPAETEVPVSYTHLVYVLAF